MMAKRSKEKPNKREQPEIVLLLFEGPSDEDALYIPLANIFDEISEKIQVFPIFYQDSLQKYGDVTSRFYVTPQNIEKKIAENAVEPFLRNNGLYPKHIKRIIQFVDTDGVYIPDSEIVQQNDASITEVIYGEKIIAPNIENIIDRNDRKRSNLDHLSSMESIKIGSKTIDYSVYYFSTNLDHVLHDNANLQDSLKRNAAIDFRMFNEEMNSFRGYFVNNNLTSGQNDYKSSWEYIKQGNNSLTRVTNVNILIDSLISLIP